MPDTRKLAKQPHAKLPSNLTEMAFATYSPIGGRDRIVENELLAWASLPFRMAMYCGFMCLFYPVMVMTALLTAIKFRIKFGTAADILKHSLDGVFKTGGTYPCLFVFKKPFTDEERLHTEWKGICKEVGMDTDFCELVFEDEKPGTEFPSGPEVENDHYMDKGYNMVKRATLTMHSYHTYIQVYNGEPGQPTVMRCFLPGHSFDGTSCFNMAKELIARYYGERSDIVVKSTLTDDAAEKLAAISFPQFLASIPYNVFLNVSDFNWMFLKSMRVFGGPGMSTEVTMLNLDESDSKRLVAGLKAKGYKPYAGFIYAAFHAYRKVENANPFSICQQVSMQSRNYVPDDKNVKLESWKKDRNFVGDWLIGVLHHFPDGDFTLDDAQAVYEALLADLTEYKGAAAKGAMAKAYCPIGGAAVFQFFPFYADKFRAMDGIFFNNYGLRTIHPDAELHSYNWGAPFRMGFNTMSVNGKTCSCLASSHMSLTKLKVARDEVLRIFQTLME